MALIIAKLGTLHHANHEKKRLVNNRLRLLAILVKSCRIVLTKQFCYQGVSLLFQNIVDPRFSDTA